jgi:hypothetical protein
MAPIYLCNCCGKEVTSRLRCGRCKNVNYCSRDCQKSDWKAHKIPCKVIASAFGQGPKRQSRLLEEWISRSTRNVKWLVGKALTRDRVVQQQPGYIVVIVLDFDYNHETFLPTKLPPPVMTRDEFPLPLEFQVPPAKENNSWQIAVLCYQDIKKFFCIGFHTNDDIAGEAEGETWEFLTDCIKAGLMLTDTSSVFQKWPPIQETNINLQISPLRATPAWNTFLLAALCMNTDTPLHATHVVVIQFEFGWALGQIQRLDSYKLWAVKDLLADMERSGNFDESMMEYYRNKLNLETRHPLQKRDYHYLRGLFLNSNTARRYSFLFVTENGIKRRQPGNTVEAEDTIAQAEFVKLQSFRFPAVSSPDIE